MTDASFTHAVLSRALINATDALARERDRRPRLSPEQVAEYMKSHAGPAIIEAFACYHRLVTGGVNGGGAPERTGADTAKPEVDALAESQEERIARLEEDNAYWRSSFGRVSREREQARGERDQSRNLYSFAETGRLEAEDLLTEVTVGLSYLAKEPLSPCVEECIGHLGPKAHQAIKDGLAAWRELERERDNATEGQAEIARLSYQQQCRLMNQAETIKAKRLATRQLEAEIAEWAEAYDKLKSKLAAEQAHRIAAEARADLGRAATQSAGLETERLRSIFRENADAHRRFLDESVRDGREIARLKSLANGYLDTIVKLGGLGSEERETARQEIDNPGIDGGEPKP